MLVGPGLAARARCVADPLVRRRAHRERPDRGDERPVAHRPVLVDVLHEEPVQRVVLVGEEAVQRGGGVVRRAGHPAPVVERPHQRERLLHPAGVVVADPVRSRGSLRNQQSWRRANRRVAADGALPGLVEAQLAGEVRRDLAVADRPAGGRPSASPSPSSRSTSATKPSSNIWSTRCSIRASRVGRSMSTPICTVRGVGVLQRRQRRRERPAGDLDDLQRADHAAAVLGEDPRRGLGVRRRRAARAAQRARPRRARPPARPGPPRRCRGTRSGPGSPGCRAPSRPTSTGTRPPRAQPRGRRPAPSAWNSATVAGRATVQGVQQVVRDPPALGDRQLGGADVHAAVDLHRVGVDDLAAERARRGPARGRSCRRRWRPTTATIGHAARGVGAVRGHVVSVSRPRASPTRPRSAPHDATSRTWTPPRARRRTAAHRRARRRRARPASRGPGARPRSGAA